jgi:hypothetical protein
MNYRLSGPMHSEASGIDQIQPSTWKAWAKETGIGQEYARASDAPPLVQDALSFQAAKKYGPNSSYTWAASAPRGGYRDPLEAKQVAGEYDDLIPKQGAAPAGKGEYDDLIPKAQQMGMPAPPNKPEQGPPQRAPGPMDPSIAARTPPVEAQPGPGTEVQKSMFPKAAAWLQTKLPTLDQVKNFQLADVLSSAMDYGMDKAHDGIVDILKQPFPGMPGIGMSDTNAHMLARDLLTEFTRQAGGEIETPAVRTADGRVVPGPSHDAITSAGTEGTPGYVTKSGEFVDKAKALEIAKVTNQAGGEAGSGVPDIPGRVLGDSVTMGGPPPNEPSIAARNPRAAFQGYEAARQGIAQDLQKPQTEEGRAAMKAALSSARSNLRDDAGLRKSPTQEAYYDPTFAPPSRKVGGEGLNDNDLRPPSPQSAGAAAVSKAQQTADQAVPPVPTKDYINSTDDSFFRLRQAATADKSEFDNFVTKLPVEMRDPDLQSRMYDHMEGGKPLAPEEQALYDKFVVPLKREEADLYGEIKKTDPLIAKDFDPEYVHRMVKGKSREFDPWMGESSGDPSPVGAYKSTSTSSLKDRVYYSIENSKGERKLVAMTDTGPMVLNKGQQAQPLPRYQGEATRPGDKFSIDGEQWQVKQAKTSEIEQQTDLKYYKNATASTIKNVVQLRAVARALGEIKRLKSTPEWMNYTRSLDGNRPKPDGWRATEFPPLRNVWMHPHLADAVDKFWGDKKLALGEKMAAINRFAVGSLFLSPIPHSLNAAAHWTTARGWDWITPQGARSLAIDGAKAMQQVITQGKDYQDFLREGGGLIYGSIANEQFHRTILKGLGEAIKREPWKWDPIARVMGVGPSDLVKMIYGASSRALWGFSDVLMMQRYYELKRKGMGTREAIADAERHIPNYRIPPQVLGSGEFARALQDPSLFTFSKYHYGMFKSYAHMAKDLGSFYKDPKAAFLAMGNVFATGALIFLVGPAINAGIQKLTGDKKLEMGPKGSTTLPVALYDAWRGKPISQVIQNSLTLAPAVKGIYEGFTNADWFTKRNIVEPADQEKHRFGRVGAQVGEKAAQDLVAPYGAAAEASGKGGLKGAAEGLAKQSLGLRKPYEPYHGKTGPYGTLEQQAAYRRTHPRGPIEAMEKKAEQWLRK